MGREEHPHTHMDTCMPRSSRIERHPKGRLQAESLSPSVLLLGGGRCYPRLSLLLLLVAGHVGADDFLQPADGLHRLVDRVLGLEEAGLAQLQVVDVVRGLLLLLLLPLVEGLLQGRQPRLRDDPDVPVVEVDERGGVRGPACVALTGGDPRSSDDGGHADRRAPSHAEPVGDGGRMQGRLALQDVAGVPQLRLAQGPPAQLPPPGPRLPARQGGLLDRDPGGPPDGRGEAAALRLRVAPLVVLLLFLRLGPQSLGLLLWVETGPP
mmetsp:Transcript_50682/g.151645  ORF Transcript_50682/g.151645 Transcript_50682/m.151645 type:complete len:266 (+) Transcript_50682:96-893(+)